MDFERLDAIARQIMLHRRSHIEREIGHVYYHGARTMVGVIELRRLITNDASHDDLLRVAALFHDCGKAIEPHDRSGPALVGEFLKDELTDDEMREVKRLIRLHDDRGHAEYDMWAKLLQDADVLDHYGSMEIWLNCNWAAYNDRAVPATIAFYRDGEYMEQANGHRALLNYEVSRKIFDEKVAFVYSVIDRFALEASGKYALTDSIKCT